MIRNCAEVVPGNMGVFFQETGFREISDKEVLHVQQYLIDNLPGKTLDYLTPFEIFNRIKLKTNICAY